MTVLTQLIDKQDTFEIVRDQIAAILADESANQQALATAAAKDPDLWKLQVFTERSEPWGKWQNVEEKSTETTPIVNVWYDGGTFPKVKGDPVERQVHSANYNIDIIGFAVNESDGAGGQKPADHESAIEAHRGLRLCRNILMAGLNTYLQLLDNDGLRIIQLRWPQSIGIFQPQFGNQAAHGLMGARLTMQVDFNEFSPQIEGVDLEEVGIQFTRSEDGQILIEADYEYPL